jgi:hypothetical protein
LRCISYCYTAYNEKVAAVRKDPDFDGTLDSVFQDFEFMQSLYATPLEKRHESAEPNKNVTISL